MLSTASVIVLCVFANVNLPSATSQRDNDKHPSAEEDERELSSEHRPPSLFSGGCRLPEHPQHGMYISPLCQPDDQRAACRNKAGTSVPPRWLLKYTCNDTYDLITMGSEFSVCDKGIWLNPLDCVQLCPPLQSLTVDVRCVFLGREVSCDRKMKPNTTATVKCKQQYREVNKPEYSSLLCKDNGEWDHKLFNCTPVNSNQLSNSKLHNKNHQPNPKNCRLPEYPKHGLYVSSLCQPEDRTVACRNVPGTTVPPHWLLKYSCSENYQLTSSDSEFSVCVNGVWNNHLDCIADPSSLNTDPSHYNTSSAERLKRELGCKQLEYTCASGQCIPSYNVCDGAKDCTDGSDETRATCKVLGIRCSPLVFECAYGACIDLDLKCDGKEDCADGSDELPCPQAVASCGSGKFQCNNGQCTDQYAICDGIKDCSDGSDETRNLCKNLKCPSSSYQCDYGACLERSVKCNGLRDCPDGSDELGCQTQGVLRPPFPTERPPVMTLLETGSCRLPEHPQHGVYISSLCQAGDQRLACRNTPGTSVPSNWLLKYTCNDNYDLTSSDSEYSVCDNGVWKNSLNCIKLCPPLQSLSVDVKCMFSGREVSCDRPMKPNTTAFAKCKQHYRETYKPEYSSLLCKDNGEWSYRLFYCTPDCGVSTKPETLTTLILDGTPTHQGDFPWLTALYLKNNVDQWEQKCAGTLITPHIVLTAAHCLVRNDLTLRPEDIKVGLGKYYRDYYKYENFSLIADVREIVTPRYYSGGNSFYALDIGLLDLGISVQVTAYIMPACVDWTSSYTINPGDVGHVAGWGTTENGTSSETVLSTQLSYIDNAACIKRLRQVLKRFVTHDKFCAGSLSGGQVDKGDSGGGLTVIKNEQHFVFGVVSTKIIEDTSFSLFTDITNTEHHAWLDEHRTRLDGVHFET